MIFVINIIYLKVSVKGIFSLGITAHAVHITTVVGGSVVRAIPARVVATHPQLVGGFAKVVSVGDFCVALSTRGAVGQCACWAGLGRRLRHQSRCL